jgi:hypothetical protein
VAGAVTLDWIESDKSYPGQPRFKDIRTILHVLNLTEYADRCTFDTRIYISSAPLDIERLAAGSRGHWGVESMQWVLDVELKDDLSCRLNDAKCGDTRIHRDGWPRSKWLAWPSTPMITPACWIVPLGKTSLAPTAPTEGNGVHPIRRSSQPGDSACVSLSRKTSVSARASAAASLHGAEIERARSLEQAKAGVAGNFGEIGARSLFAAAVVDKDHLEISTGINSR